ncbi:substrate-binding domain-containing protein [Cytophaga hutchinsonii]|uniref:Phosphate ABC transporter substrate-binding protein, PhoT family n=1 Tax=Cytophaga hutchinsonii (strain ATCC 33406 / DSM 1761 / CIP 103989 / NBRC 15051 / NCIMB 9469 / D465) TaxID=269798 RepID=A0A6N4SSA3_CYTH3|nr:substrate-binding domain-containing protein [Cytophaga hutchinsonii]ABG59279.1 phosphate ABC transporter substrate-binding protein, PhoT family [Cytophaga hutchinsonii ATCC 33406]SFX32742.1 PBP superfamily domain-containing protein [Cytophaga hutchinsonii ATCC 33406]
MNTVFKYILFYCSFLFLASCSEKTESTNASSTPVDSVTVLCDPSWESIVRTFITTYEGLNPHRKVTLLVKPESECIHALLKDTYRTVFVSRNFTASEQAFIEKKEWGIHNDSLCYDGLTWIAPKSFPKDSLTLDEIKELFQSGTLNNQAYTIQLNSSGSSVANYLTERLGVPPSTKHIYTGGNDEDIIRSVQVHKNALACISSSWLVNLEDKRHRDYLASVKVLKIAKTPSSEAYSPFQNDLALGTYPFMRVLRVLNHDANAGMGTAFASYFISNRGQRIFLKAGLLPYKMPAREVELKIEH